MVSEWPTLCHIELFKLKIREGKEFKLSHCVTMTECQHRKIFWFCYTEKLFTNTTCFSLLVFSWYNKLDSFTRLFPYMVTPSQRLVQFKHWKHTTCCLSLSVDLHRKCGKSAVKTFFYRLFILLKRRIQPKRKSVEYSLNCTLVNGFWLNWWYLYWSG